MGVPFLWGGGLFGRTCWICLNPPLLLLIYFVFVYLFTYLFVRFLLPFLTSGGATPGRARSNDMAGRSIALAPPCLLLCFTSVIVWRENKNFTISDRWPLYLFYFNSETILAVLAACVLRATTLKGRQLFWIKKVHTGDLARGCSDFEMTSLLCCAGAAIGPYLFYFCVLHVCVTVTYILVTKTIQK